MSRPSLDRPETSRFAVSPERIGRLLIGSSIVVAIMSYTMHLVQRARGADTIAMLDVGDEVSIGTWFETVLFLLAAIALASLASSSFTAPHLRKRVRLLAWVFVALSIDESVSIHERMGSAIREVLSTSGYLYYIWVVPVVVAALVLAVWELPWLRSLPSGTAIRVIFAGALFIAAAGGLEMLAGPGDEASGTDSLLSVTLTAFEELGEMVAVSYFVVQVVGLQIGGGAHLAVVGGDPSIDRAAQPLGEGSVILPAGE